jgi:hypothetical protein
MIGVKRMMIIYIIMIRKIDGQVFQADRPSHVEVELIDREEEQSLLLEE